MDAANRTLIHKIATSSSTPLTAQIVFSSSFMSGKSERQKSCKEQQEGKGSLKDTVKYTFKKTGNVLSTVMCMKFGLTQLPHKGLC
jgi:hypothetical protein